MWSGVILLTLTFPPEPVIDPKAMNLLRMVDERWASIHTLSGEEVCTIRRFQPKPGELTTSSRLRLMRPIFARVDMAYRSVRESTYITKASDGQTIWTVFSKSFSKSPCTGDASSAVKMNGEQVAGFFSPDRLLQRKVEALKDLDLLHEVRLISRKPQVVRIASQEPGSQVVDRDDYTIGPDLLVKDFDRVLSDGSKTVHYELKDVRIDEPMTKESFSFKVSPGLKDTSGTLTEAPPPKPPMLAGTMAPDLNVVDGHGKQLRLASFKGKIVVLDFWASWCGNCTMGLPNTNKLAKRYAGTKVVVLAADCADSSKVFRSWVAKHPQLDAIRFALDPDGLDGNGPYAKLYHSGIPSQIVIDREGHIVTSINGDDIKRVERCLVSLLASEHIRLRRGSHLPSRPYSEQL